MKTPVETGYAPVNGLNMYYEIHGDGDMPLVLLHGGGSTIESCFGNILPFLSAKRKIIAMELQAHGRTEDRGTQESFVQDADDVAKLLHHLKIEKADFLGFSNGATTTLHIAILHPAIVNKIVVIAGAYRRDGFFPGFFDFMKDASLDNMPAPLKAAFLKVNPSESGLLAMFTQDKNRMIGFNDIPDTDVAGIHAKALIMTGDKDVATLAHTLRMVQTIPGAELVVLPGAHGAMIGEVCAHQPNSKQPEITAQLVDEFLEK